MATTVGSCRTMSPPSQISVLMVPRSIPCAGRLGAGARSAPVAAGGLKPECRAAQGRLKRQVFVSLARDDGLQHCFGPRLGGLRTFHVYLVHILTHVGQDGYDIRPDLHEAAGNGECLLRATLADAQDSISERGEQRGVIRKDAHLPLTARRHNDVHLPLKQEPVLRGDLTAQRHRVSRPDP
jgi:hypothetical protein